MELVELLNFMRQNNASDMLIRVGCVPVLRILGEITTENGLPPLSYKQVEEITKVILKEEEQNYFYKKHELDTIISLESLGRFRIHFFHQRNTPSIAIRAIPFRIPTIEEIGLPKICKDLCSKLRGMIVVTGPSGCGKTTTQAAMVDYINTNLHRHIITIEDPIEFIHTPNKSIISQRQLGRDTFSFGEALKHVFRQDPDVILVGEMRDLETIQLTVTAAETGHLVIATLHTGDSIQTVERIIESYPRHQQQQIKVQLSMNLLAIISQVLARRNDKPEMIAAYELLIATSACRNLIREGKIYQLISVLQTGTKQGMQTINQALYNLYKNGIITVEEAMRRSNNPIEFKRLGVLE